MVITDEMREYATKAFHVLLDGGSCSMITHEPSRRVVEAMKAKGWEVFHLERGMSKWVSPTQAQLVLMAGTDAHPHPWFLLGSGIKVSHRGALKAAMAG